MKLNQKIFTSIIITFFGILMLLVKSDIQEILYNYYNRSSATFFSFVFTIFSLTITLIGSTRIVFDYLQGRFSNNNIESPALTKKIDTLEAYINRIKSFDVVGDETQSIVYEKINALTTADVIKKVEENFGNSIIEKIKFETITKDLYEIKNRLELETKRISRNSSLNLSLGFATTIFAISFLSYSLLTSDPKSEVIPNTIIKAEDIKSSFYIFLVKFLPRLSVSVFIELFSFFFLRIYKRNLEDIKYLNNERTNVELKLLALNTSIITNDNDTLKQILLDLVKTERNFILKKDETTVELQKGATESNAYKDTLENIAKILKRN